MATNADRWAVDTSVAVAAVDSSHAAHGSCAAIVRSRRPALAGHAAFETYSVLTRMPGDLQVDASSARDILGRTFPDVYWVAPDRLADLWVRLAVLGITGGSVYDALVGEAARTNGSRLISRDLRARRTYDLLGVDCEYLAM
ncbi:MAG TPA: type II toxin-antitoxin system VapC family toxin [Microthrixaceae bacterium]|jgi:predicted nucleic acid-binding protein|nr:type II toxin-antitoxin system VapC family toxin [Microthrixaceae bacterium]